MMPDIFWNMKKNIQDIIQTMGAQNKKKNLLEIYAELRNIMISNIGTPDYVLKAFNTLLQGNGIYIFSPSAVRRCCFEIASLDFSYMEESWRVRKKESWMHSKSLSSAGKRPGWDYENVYWAAYWKWWRDNIIPFPMPKTLYRWASCRGYFGFQHCGKILYHTELFSRLFKIYSEDVMNTLSERGLRRRRAFWKLPASRLERLLWW